MKNIGNMMKQAQQMQANMQKLQDQLGETEIQGSAGAGMVAITLSGKGDMKSIKILPAAVDPDDIEVLEDLIKAAYSDAKQKMERYVADETGKLMGGLSLPAGLKLPF